MLRRSPLRKVSKKRQAELRIYHELRLKYLNDWVKCQVCEKQDSTDIHHKLPRGRGGKLNDITIFLAVCRDCHNLIHKQPKWAEEQGYLLKCKTLKT
ncbi:MAG: HNH endonuclease [Caulobacteraceae bacterium]|nr:HNH endonuclease [Caulobacteraceae bacterium]